MGARGVAGGGGGRAALFSRWGSARARDTLLLYFFCECLIHVVLQFSMFFAHFLQPWSQGTRSMAGLDKAQGSRLKAQGSRLKAQGSRLKAQV